MARHSATKTRASKPKFGQSGEGAWSERDIAGAVALIAAALWIFWPALQGGWLQDWDDNELVTNNPDLRTLSGLWKIWFALPANDYWPLTSTFLWIEWQIFGDQTTGYHLCSLALHIFSGFLIWRLLGRLGLRWGWLGGLLFVVHPLAVESVAWISETKNTLSLPLFLLSFDAYLDLDGDGKKSASLRSLAFFFAAMLAKTSVVMLPFVLLLFCWWKRGRIARQDFLRCLPFFLIALVLGSITLCLQSQALNVPGPGSPLAILLCAGQEIFFYAGNFFFPANLCLIYPRWTFSPPTLLQLSTCPLLAVLLVVLWTQRKTWGRHALFALGFFLLTLLPTLGFLKMVYMRITWAADHFVYLPMIGLVGLTVVALEYGCGLLPANARPYGLGLITALAACLSYASYNHAADFANEETLWRATEAINPAALPAYNNLGMVMMKAGQGQPAIDQFNQAIKLDPDSAEAHSNLGYVFEMMGRSPEAAAQFRESVRLKPGEARSHFNLGTLLLTHQQFPQAIDELQQAVKLDADFVDAEDNLGSAFEHSGRPADAVPCFQRAIQAQPDSLDAHFNLGITFLDLNRFTEAAKEFETVLQIDPNAPGAGDLLAKARAGEPKKGP